MTAAEQLVLPLAQISAAGREDFLVAPANRAAVAWIDAWPGWPGPALVLAGPAGSGKSHLAGLWRARAGATLIEGRSLTPESVPALAAAGAPLLVEDAEAALPRPLLHLFNAVAERRGHLLLTARRRPAQWAIDLADLRSRLVAAPVAMIGAPDESLIRALLIKLFADRQLRVGVEVIDYLTLRLERSFDAARAAVAALDAVALAEGRPVTVRLVAGRLDERGRLRD